MRLASLVVRILGALRYKNPRACRGFLWDSIIKARRVLKTAFVAVFLFVTYAANATIGHKRNDAEQRLPLGGKLSAELTDEGFVN